ncbi:MAG: phosphoribosylglycinamide formyltransferase [Clostridiaceae bacterium]
MLRIAVLISGGGSNLQSIIDSINKDELQAKIDYVISDKEGVYGLERAKKDGIKTYILDRKIYKDKISDEILKIVKGVDLIVLAGFLSILNGDVIKEYKNKIINIHPSLIPSFCGPSMYGINVHKSALEYGVKISGCTVHFVDEGTDTGPIIVQRTVPVYSSDTPKLLQERVLNEEHKALPQAISLIAEKKINIDGRKVYIN